MRHHTPGYDTDTWAWVAAHSASVPGDVGQVADNIVGWLKDNSLWTTRDWIGLFPGKTNQAGALLNLRNPAKSFLAKNSITWGSGVGFTGDAVSMHLTLNDETFNGGGNSFVKDSASVMIYTKQVGASHVYNAVGATSRLNIVTRDTAGNNSFLLSDATTSALLANSGSRTGLWAIDRSGASVKQGYKDGAQTANLSVASTTVVSGAGTILRDGSGYSGDTAVFFMSGSSFSASAALHLDFYTNVLLPGLTRLGAN